MAAYVLTSYVTPEGALPTVVAALETKLETIETAKVVRFTKVIELPNRLFIGILVYDA